MPTLLSAALLLLAACAALLTTSPAAADPVEDCTASHGAVVAVDFGPFGGPVERGCDATPTTGYDLLHEGGFTTTGTQHDGPAFICRIGSGDFDSGTQYPTPDQDDCVLTPPATAYWSYWTAAPGQDEWTYSAYGAMDRELEDGDVDAWVYGGTDVGGSTGEPDFSPDDVRATAAADPGEPSGEPTGAPGDIDLDAAAHWLGGTLTDGEHVDADDSGTPDYALTTDAAYALAAAGADSATLDKVTAYLTAHTADRAYPDGTGKAPDAAGAAGLALLAEITGRDPGGVDGHDLVGDLTDHVCPAGPDSGRPAPGCTAKGDFHGATHTGTQALALLAVVRAGATPPASAVARLAQLQCEGGGFTGDLIRPDEHCDADAATTGLAALVLHAVGGHPDAVSAAHGYLTANQRADGAFPGRPGSTTGSVTATAQAAQALRALGDDGRADAATGWLARHQLDGGGFAFDEGGTTPAVHPTSPAVLAGAATDLATLRAPGAEPRNPADDTTTTGPGTQAAGGGPDLAKGVAYLTGADRLRQGRYYASGPADSGADYGLTIDGAYALAATGLDDTGLRGIVDFLDGGGKDSSGRTMDAWTGVGTEYAAGGSLGKTALLAEAVGRDPRDFGGHDLIAALDKAVCAGPSTAPDRSCAAKGAYTYAPSVFSQALAVMAQLRAGDKDAAAGPLAYLKSLQQDSGAWPSLIPATGDADVDSTAIAAMALHLAGGDAADKAVDKALSWLAGRQLDDGGFPGAAGDSVNSAALAVQGLSLDAVTYRQQIADARTFLAAQQNPDGGFNVAAEGQRGSDLRASTQAVGGATGISFGTLDRDLSGTSAPPTPTPSGSGGAPEIVTPGGEGTGEGGGGGGALASTGVQAGALAALALLLLTVAGWRVVVVARRRAGEGSHR
ncbi:prenyltransferase/squalene oxidase repeat-containing protein [Streptomyces sp. NPDC050560]|uniref:prenyltransferase/squalene oxidase repeat-containing protein n=1 Tax=Streptomyces sp. NPDC050560 TaxID=3365630 RepID=UPI00379C58B1